LYEVPRRRLSSGFGLGFPSETSSGTRKVRSGCVNSGEMERSVGGSEQTSDWVSRLEEELEREKSIRRRILRDFNKLRDDFTSDQEYEDYLEMVEELIFNLVHGIDVERTNERIAAYRKENAALIRRNQLKWQEREQAEAAQLAADERARQTRLAALAREDEEEKRQRRLAEEHERTRRLQAALRNDTGRGGTRAQQSALSKAPGAQRPPQLGADDKVRVNVHPAHGSRGGSALDQRSPTDGKRIVVDMPSARALDIAQNPEERYPDPLVRNETARKAAGFDPNAWIRRARAQLCV